MIIKLNNAIKGTNSCESLEENDIVTVCIYDCAILTGKVINLTEIGFDIVEFEVIDMCYPNSHLANYEKMNFDFDGIAFIKK